MSTFLQMMPGGMMPSGWDWGSMWLALILPSLLGGVAVIAIVVLFLRHGERHAGVSSAAYTTPTKSIQASATGGTETLLNHPKIEALGEVLRSLAPTLMDDERRVMDEMVKAGGEILQSDLPRMTDFSKATVSKAIHGLEVRGIVVRERHKWTYWCKVNSRLVERVLRTEPDL